MPFEKTQELIRGRGPQNSAYPSYKSPYGPNCEYTPLPQSPPQAVKPDAPPEGRRIGSKQSRLFGGGPVKRNEDEIADPDCFTRGMKAGAFGGVALFAVIFYASGIPRVQQDILMKVPGLRSYYVKDIPASDNPF
ncbi:hypothetical protein PG993_002323 [Apiospora rasikravindrae]|uniref:Uncharacterized protein n=1 Tax=Apiospora rasikravindrae TaxID=990691 RepID=A0ABR1TWD3_9PEZI